MYDVNDIHHERRSAKRFLVSLPVETDRGSGVTRDVSVAGLFLVADAAFTVGERLRLTLTVPDPDHTRGRTPLQVLMRGKVVRVEKNGKNAGAGIALDEESRYLTRTS